MTSLHETYEALNLEPKPIRPHILAAATVSRPRPRTPPRRSTPGSTVSVRGFCGPGRPARPAPAMSCESWMTGSP